MTTIAISAAPDVPHLDFDPFSIEFFAERRGALRAGACGAARSADVMCGNLPSTTSAAECLFLGVPI